jgi:hypothetical protein
VKLGEDAHIEAEIVAFPPLVPEQVQLFQLQYQRCGRYGKKSTSEPSSQSWKKSSSHRKSGIIPSFPSIVEPIRALHNSPHRKRAVIPGLLLKEER